MKTKALHNLRGRKMSNGRHICKEKFLRYLVKYLKALLFQGTPSFRVKYLIFVLIPNLNPSRHTIVFVKNFSPLWHDNVKDACELGQTTGIHDGSSRSWRKAKGKYQSFVPSRQSISLSTMTAFFQYKRKSYFLLESIFIL